MNNPRETFVFIASSPELMVLLKTTAVIAAGLLIVWTYRSARAAIRHLCLTCTFVVMLLVPAAALIAPSLRFEIADAKTGVTASQVVQGPIDNFQNTNNQTNSTNLSASAPARFSWRKMIWMFWALGAALLVTRLAISLVRLRLIRRAGIPSLELNQTTRVLTTSAGMRRQVEVLLHDDVEVPFTSGFLRPMILLPSDACVWSELELQRVLVHELEHIKRGDWLVQVLVRTVCAFYWFQPLVWIAWRQICLEAERACDDAVVLGNERTAYAEQLVNLAKRLSHTLAPPVLSMANRSDLSRRVSAILDQHQARGKAGTRWTVATLAVTALLASAIAPGLEITRTYASTPQTQSKNTKKNKALNSALLEASEEGKVKDVEELLAAGADINGTVEGDGTALIVAARAGNKPVVQFLLQKGADPNVASPGDGNALIMAAQDGHAEIVDLLINSGARVNEVVEGDENALIKASGSGHVDVVQLLLSRGADVNMRVWSDGEWRTALKMARKGGHNSVVQLLIAAGARE
ncbi:MAG TPA: M56 family metallopeptidase [Pyrinomonadaceae bacterium]|nr:M56 family metallopeptidase [Pyrinomonadaceae bacterium]